MIKVTTEKGNDKDSQDYIKELNSGSCKSVWGLCDCKGDKHINAGPDSHYACDGQGYLRWEEREVE